MLTIRLSRVGKKKQPTYRFIISEKTKDPWGDNLEILGHYNPRTSPPTLVIKEDRLKHWISKGAQMSDTVNNLLIDKKLVQGDKRRIVKLSQKRQAAVAEQNQKVADEKAKADAAKEEAKKQAEESAEGGSASGGKAAEPVPPEAAPETPAETPAEPEPTPEA